MIDYDMLKLAKHNYLSKVGYDPKNEADKIVT